MNTLSSERLKARRLLDTYGGEVDDYFKLWPEDKYFFFSSDNKAFLAYGLAYHVAVCMGDPAGKGSSIDLLLDEFNRYCKKKHLVIAIIQTTDKYLVHFKRAKLKPVLIGADAVINTSDFSISTMHNKYFRNIVNRFTKAHYQVIKQAPPHSKELLRELKEVSNSWLTLPAHKEWYFLTGRFSTRYVQQAPVYALRDRKGKAIAFLNQLISFKPDVATIDLMRHCNGSPPNSMDFLFARFIEMVHKDGFTAFNLGMSPLDGKPFVDQRSDKLLMRIYGINNHFIGFSGLHRFKAKYRPDWEPRYAVYQGSVLRIPQIALAVFKLMRTPNP